jgi:lysophospholipase L1-like esterase
MLDYDPERFWKLKPNRRVDDPANMFWKGHVSNSLGFRSPEFTLEKSPTVIRVVCFGDSSTFGIGVKIEDTWPVQLETLLNNDNGQQRYQVINAGVPGYSSYQGLRHMRQEIDRLQPDIVIATYANNDFWRWDDRTDAEQAGRLANHGQHGILSGSRALQLVDRYLSPAIRKQRSRWAETATRNYVDPQSQWVPRVPLDEFKENIVAMSDLCEKRKVPLVLVAWPDQWQVMGHWSPRIRYQDVLRQVALERDLAVADVVHIFREHRPESVQTYIPNDIVHVNRSGNRLAALAALKTLRMVLTDARNDAELTSSAYHASNSGGNNRLRPLPETQR